MTRRVTRRMTRHLTRQIDGLVEASTCVDKGFEHLEQLSDSNGLFEHALGTVRRSEHGYCTDDNARLLLASSRDTDVDRALRLGATSLGFVLASLDSDGRVHNRMDLDGRWVDTATVEDCWGRAMWALGFTAAHHSDVSIRHAALAGFRLGARLRSPWPRAMAFAVLGAAELAMFERDGAAHELLRDAVSTIPGAQDPGVRLPSWRWPEARLRYANASLAEAVIACGVALRDTTMLARGVDMLRWLLEIETPAGHLSLTGVGGRGPGDLAPQFDQQAIEAAAMADACWRAFGVTGDGSWLDGIELAERWFRGNNDSCHVMFDDVSGGGFDGLEPDGVNENQGAESTLALVSTMQRAQQRAQLCVSVGS